MNEFEEDALSPQRQELLRHILDEDTLAYVEEKFAGVVRLRLCRRTRAIVEIKLKGDTYVHTLIYHLPEDELDPECALTIDTYTALWIKPEYPDLWAFAAHRAAEAMLALRNGHKEYGQVTTRRRKAASAQKEQADVP